MLLPFRAAFSEPLTGDGQLENALAANSANVCSPLIASRATFDLKSAEYRFRVTLPISRPSSGQDWLSTLSEAPGPPHSRLAAHMQAFWTQKSGAKMTPHAGVS